MIKKVEKKFKKVNSQKGFTLLEILVVLTIMGFLIAMVAPRLAGISGSAVDTVCDTNQNRMVTYLSSFFEKTNRFPSGLTNLVISDGAALDATTVYQIPAVSNQDPDDGAEVLANELYSRNHFHIHYLDVAEADELKNMGIVELFNLNDYSGMYWPDGTAKTVLELADLDNDFPMALVTAERPSMEPVTPQDPAVVRVGVAMVGCGMDVAGAWVATNATERGWGEPANFGRIVLGMGPECGLITSGVISNAAHCPGGIQNADNVTYNDYILLLPRLEATADSMITATTPITTDIPGAAALGCVAYDDEPYDTGVSTYDYVANGENLRVRDFDITKAQEGWQFATMCPEGHMYPADDEEFWGVDLADGGTIL